MSERQYVVAGFAVPQGLDELHRLLEDVGRDHPDLDAADLMLFETAVIEIAGNVIEHGLGATTWTFTLTLTSAEMRGTLVDNGTVVDLDLDAELPDDLLAESGRGLALARSTLDEFSYERVDDTNRWSLVRLRQRAT